MPDAIRAEGDKAIEHHQKRPCVAEIRVIADQDGWTFFSPYIRQDRDRWEALLFETFGTRSPATFQVFTDQLARLCGNNWDAESKVWMPDEHELIAALMMVKANAPRNEAEAALAAQMVAIHIATMKTAKNVCSSTYADERTAATLARLARTYAMQIDAMRKLKGKRRVVKQTITVVNRKEIHDHRHQYIHYETGGSRDFGAQAQAPGSDDGSETQGNGGQASVPRECKALPRSDSTGKGLPLSGCEGKSAVPLARRRQGLRGSER